MEFRVLGPLGLVGDDGSALPLGGIKQRALLAALLLEAGRPVSTHRLTELVWDNPPSSAAHAVEVYVSKLRKTLAAAEPERRQARIGRTGAGYAVHVEAGELDLLCFRALACQGGAAASRGDAAGGAAVYAQALALWRGEPLACIDGTPLARQAQRELEEERIAAAEGYVDAALASGRHEELLPPLRRLVAAHPLHEKLVARLMLALYRAGRQAEALDTYLGARRQLQEELGVEPGRELRDLQRRILAHAPELDPPAATASVTQPATVLDLAPAPAAT